MQPGDQLEVEDVHAEDLALEHVSDWPHASRHVLSYAPPGEELPLSLLRDAMQLAFGSATAVAGSWVGGFKLREHAAVAWGLEQREGGPCGLLAAVQAETIASFL